MKKTSLYLLILSMVLILMAFTLPPKKKIKVWMIGDSTMAIKETKAYPETGWGMPFVYFFDSTVVIDNRAKNGRSTRTFIEQQLWQPVADSMQSGDYLFIQFGHNDEAKDRPDKYTSLEDYKKYLVLFITTAQKKNAYPVLLTPVTRRKFDAQGNITETHKEYSAAAEQVAKECNVPLIDLDTKSRELLQQFGDENSKLLFMQLAPGEHPNYPEGKNDNTHFNELGARKMAQIVLAEMRKLNLELASRIVVPPPAKQ